MGFMAAPVEAGANNFKKDLFGIFDLLAFKRTSIPIADDRPRLVQVTSRGNMSSRQCKIEDHPDLNNILAYFDVEVHGWAKKHGRWTVKVLWYAMDDKTWIVEYDGKPKDVIS